MKRKILSIVIITGAFLLPAFAVASVRLVGLGKPRSRLLEDDNSTSVLNSTEEMSSSPSMEPTAAPSYESTTRPSDDTTPNNNNTDVTSTYGGPLPGKKGIGLTLRDDDWWINIPRVLALDPSWNYSWGSRRIAAQPSHIEFIPMIWGAWKDGNGVRRRMQQDILPNYVKRLCSNFERLYGESPKRLFSRLLNMMTIRSSTTLRFWTRRHIQVPIAYWGLPVDDLPVLHGHSTSHHVPVSFLSLPSPRTC